MANKRLTELQFQEHIGGVFDTTTNFRDSDGIVDNVKSYGKNYYLVNKIGALYPSGYEDPQSGIQLLEPRADYPKGNTTGSYRDAFIRYYEQNWRTPKYFKWTDVEIHHMRPKEYAGSNNPSNLIPLWKAGATPKNGIMSHTVLTNWWRNY